jgi:formylglycine-generating enzyme required for sulfatase activity
MSIFKRHWLVRFVVRACIAFALTLLWLTSNEARAGGAEVTIRGSLVCNGACISDPKAEDHVLVVFAIDGTDDIRARVDGIVKDLYPDQGLDTDAAQKVMDRFGAELKYYVSPDSPALKDRANPTASYYCMPATASAVTGKVSKRDGKKWINATRIEPARLTYPPRMLAPDRPSVMPSRRPLTLQVGEKLTLKCVPIPAGRFLMGTPFYMWPYHVEEYPHPVTLTRDYYLAEIPITQEMYQAVMGNNPSRVRGPQLPVHTLKFKDIERFCDTLSKQNGKKVRLPTSAEWEYAARVGTSSPAFAEKYRDQNSSGPEGYKYPLQVKSKKPNTWGLYDMASCWWEITGDKAAYHVRKAVTDPHFPPGAGTDRSQRTGRGIVNDRWSICTHEFIGEREDYAGQKFRVLVEIEQKGVKKLR